MLLIRGSRRQKKRLGRGPLREPLQPARSEPTGIAPADKVFIIKASACARPLMNSVRDPTRPRPSASTPSSARPPTQAGALLRRPDCQARSNRCQPLEPAAHATPGQDLYPAAGPAAIEVPCARGGRTAVRLHRHRLPALRGAGAMTKGGPGGQLVRAACPVRQSFRRSYCQVDG